VEGDSTLSTSVNSDTPASTRETSGASSNFDDERLRGAYGMAQDKQDEQDLHAVCGYLARLPPHIVPIWDDEQDILVSLRELHRVAFSQRGDLNAAVTHLEELGRYTDLAAVKRVAAHLAHVRLTEDGSVSDSSGTSSAEYGARPRQLRGMSDAAVSERARVTFPTVLALHLSRACAAAPRETQRLESELQHSLASRPVLLALLSVLNAARPLETRAHERSVAAELARVYDDQAGNDRVYVTYASVKRELVKVVGDQVFRSHKCIVRGMLLICMHMQSEKVLHADPAEQWGSGVRFRGSRERAFVTATNDVLECHGLRWHLPACAVSKGAVAKSVHVSAARDTTPLRARCCRVVVVGAARPVELFGAPNPTIPSNESESIRSSSPRSDRSDRNSGSPRSAPGPSWTDASEDEYAEDIEFDALTTDDQRSRMKKRARAQAFRVAVTTRRDGSSVEVRVGGDILDAAVGRFVARQLSAAEGSDDFSHAPPAAQERAGGSSKSGSVRDGSISSGGGGGGSRNGGSYFDGFDMSGSFAERTSDWRSREVSEDDDSTYGGLRRQRRAASAESIGRGLSELLARDPHTPVATWGPEAWRCTAAQLRALRIRAISSPIGSSSQSSTRGSSSSSSSSSGSQDGANSANSRRGGVGLSRDAVEGDRDLDDAAGVGMIGAARGLFGVGRPAQFSVWSFPTPGGLMHMCDLQRSVCVVTFSLDDALDALAAEAETEGVAAAAAAGEDETLNSKRWLDELIARLAAVRAHKLRRRFNSSASGSTRGSRASSPTQLGSDEESSVMSGVEDSSPLNVVLVGEISVQRLTEDFGDSEEFEELLDEVNELLLVHIDELDVAAEARADRTSVFDDVDLECWLSARCFIAAPIEIEIEEVAMEMAGGRRCVVVEGEEEEKGAFEDDEALSSSKEEAVDTVQVLSSAFSSSVAVTVPSDIEANESEEDAKGAAAVPKGAAAAASAASASASAPASAPTPASTAVPPSSHDVELRTIRARCEISSVICRICDELTASSKVAFSPDVSRRTRTPQLRWLYFHRILCAIARDGRILILETETRRIAAQECAITDPAEYEAMVAYLIDCGAVLRLSGLGNNSPYGPGPGPQHSFLVAQIGPLVDFLGTALSIAPPEKLPLDHSLRMDGFEPALGPATPRPPAPYVEEKDPFWGDSIISAAALQAYWYEHTDPASRACCWDGVRLSDGRPYALRLLIECGVVEALGGGAFFVPSARRGGGQLSIDDARASASAVEKAETTPVLSESSSSDRVVSSEDSTKTKKMVKMEKTETMAKVNMDADAAECFFDFRGFLPPLLFARLVHAAQRVFALGDSGKSGHGGESSGEEPHAETTDSNACLTEWVAPGRVRLTLRSTASSSSSSSSASTGEEESSRAGSAAAAAAELDTPQRAEAEAGAKAAAEEEEEELVIEIENLWVAHRLRVMVAPISQAPVALHVVRSLIEKIAVAHWIDASITFFAGVDDGSWARAERGRRSDAAVEGGGVDARVAHCTLVDIDECVYEYEEIFDEEEEEEEMEEEGWWETSDGRELPLEVATRLEQWRLPPPFVAEEEEEEGEEEDDSEEAGDTAAAS